MKKLFKFISVAILFSALSATASETVEGAKKDYESFKQEMSIKLDKVENELAELKTKAKQKGSDAQDDAIVELEKTQAKLKAELVEAKQATNKGWKNFKVKFAASVDTLNSKIQKKLKD